MRSASDETHVQVCVRVRPLLSDEASRFERQCTRVADGTSIVVGNDRTFGFDRVFSPDVDGDAVFQAVGLPTMEAFMDGFNSTIMAYGQTGAGKTYTMDDVMRRCVSHLHSALSRVECKISLTVLEIYNEQVIDLLDPARPRLQIREGCDGGVFAAGQLVAEVDSPGDLLTYIESATSSRSTASTNINAASSRSHCIATVILTVRSDGARTTSRLNFVDLAGSERIKKSHASSGTERVREGIHINGGLLALGNVIHALCDGKAHIPFRASKLTRILQPSLAGNSRTVMIACVSSSDRSMDETLNTLKYADRARRIRLSVTRNAQILDDVSHERTLALLRNEVRRLQCVLREHNVPLPPPEDGGLACDDHILYDADTTRDFQKRVITLEEDLARERRFSRTLEEDLYRAEFCAMREVEVKKELQRQVSLLQMQLEDGSAEAAAHDCHEATNVQRAPQSAEDSQAETEQSLEERERQIKSLEEEHLMSQRTIEDYQRRLKSVLSDKTRLQRELEAAERRLEDSQMEKHKKEQHRASLKASYEARLRAAEVAAAEYRRRVRDAEAVARARHADEERLAKLRREAAALQDQLQRQRNVNRQEQAKLGKLVVNQRTELSSLSRKLRELEASHKPQHTPRRNVAAARHAPSVSTPRTQREDGPQQEAAVRGLDAAIASLMALDQDLADAEKEREGIRNTLELAQASSETARWRRALKGFQLRLEQVESEIRQCDGSAASDDGSLRRQQALMDERRSIQKKMMQLDELRPACDEALELLREVEERIDSLRAARTYRMKVVRSMQEDRDATTCSSSNTARDTASGRRGPEDDNYGLRDTVRAQQLLIEELNQRITDQALLLQQLLPVSKQANRTILLRGEE